MKRVSGLKNIALLFLVLSVSGGIIACTGGGDDSSMMDAGDSMDGGSGMTDPNAVTLHLTSYGNPTDPPRGGAVVVISNSDGSLASTATTDGTGTATFDVPSDAIVTVLAGYHADEIGSGGYLYSYFHVNGGQLIWTPVWLYPGEYSEISGGSTFNSAVPAATGVVPDEVAAGSCFFSSNEIPDNQDLDHECVQSDGTVSGIVRGTLNGAPAFLAFQDCPLSSSMSGSWSLVSDTSASRTYTFSATGDRLSTQLSAVLGFTRKGTNQLAYPVSAGTQNSSTLAGVTAEIPNVIQPDGLMSIVRGSLTSGTHLRRTELRTTQALGESASFGVDLSVPATQGGWIAPTSDVTPDFSNLARPRIHWTASPDAVAATFLVGHIDWDSTTLSRVDWFVISPPTQSDFSLPVLAGTPIAALVAKSTTLNTSQPDADVIYARTSWLNSYSDAIATPIVRAPFDVDTTAYLNRPEGHGFHYPMPVGASLSIAEEQNIYIEQTRIPF